MKSAPTKKVLALLSPGGASWKATGLVPVGGAARPAVPMAMVNRLSALARPVTAPIAPMRIGTGLVVQSVSLGRDGLQVIVTLAFAADTLTRRPVPLWTLTAPLDGLMRRTVSPLVAAATDCRSMPGPILIV